MMRRMTTTGALLLICAAAAAQDAPETEPGEIPRFTVEVIIFEYAEDVAVGTEQFRPVEPPPGGPDAATGELVFGDTNARPGSDAGARGATPQFMRHAETEFTMTDIARRLERLDVYRPVMHFAWTQVTLPEEETRPIELQTLADPADGWDGSFTLYLSRYLHLVVDLSLEQRSSLADPLAVGDSARVYGDDRGVASYDEAVRGPVRLRIFEDRIFKSGDLRYFDHPKFGVLAKITRVGEPDDA